MIAITDVGLSIATWNRSPSFSTHSQVDREFRQNCISTIRFSTRHPRTLCSKL